jgi:Xaa-Pro aminopeptidase
MKHYTSATPAEELGSRIAKLQLAMQKIHVEAALIVQKTDLFYFSGTSQQGWLYVPSEGKPLLMVFKEYDRALLESGLDEIISVVSPKKIPQRLQERGYRLPKVLGMELDVLPANLYFQYNAIFEGSEIQDISFEIRLVRAVKSSYEQDIIRRACALSDKVASRVPEFISPGKTEVELAGEIEAYARSLGHQGIVRMRLFGSELFYGHLMSGAAAAVPSYLASPTGGEGVSGVIGQGAGFKKIVENEPILVDYVFALNGYISDHTRIFSIGSLPDELVRAHEAMLELQNEVMKLAVPGIETGELYKHMIGLAEENGYAEYFMGVGERKIRFTGHGVGLELDEFPFIASGQKLRLEAGMVIAIEPKVIFPGKGVVGIENTHLVTNKGLERLSLLNDHIRIL